MPKASPSLSTNYQVISNDTIFLLLHTIVLFLGASVCFSFVLFAALYLLDPSILIWERDTLRFLLEYSCSSLILVEYSVWAMLKLLALVFHVSLVQSY